tara:strand:- start:5944 stop:6456 length:513 start_codon:yes stop_codon:yes gene_type:complete
MVDPGGDEAFTYAKYLAKSVTKPGYTVGTTTHKFLGNTYYYPGSVEWNAVTATIVNAINPDGNALLVNALATMGYLRPDIQENVVLAGQAPGTVNKADALSALGIVTIQEVNGEGGLVGSWQLINAFITNATFGDLSYDNDTELLNITCEMRYDYAIYESGPAVAFAASP